MKQKSWKSTLLTLLLFILLSGIKPSVIGMLPEESDCPSIEVSAEGESASDGNGINPLSDRDDPISKIDIAAFCHPKMPLSQHHK